MAEASAQGGASGRAPGRPILFELARLAAVVALPFRLSPPLIGKISKTWGITAVQPVRRDDGSVIGAVGMAIDLRELQPFGRVDREHVIAGIVAYPGIVIAHSTAPEQWIGKDVGGTPAIAAMLARSEGTLRDAVFDTRDRLWAFRQVGGTSWVAYAGVDAESALAPTRRRAVAALLLVTVIVGATIIAAAYSARRIARPISAIAEVARARASGALDARAAIDGPREAADVDDDPLVLESLRATLESEGHKVTAVDGGQAGIDTFTETQQRDDAFDVVITDLGMPHVDGRRVAAAVKAASPSTPIVLLTGWGQRLVEDGDIPAHVDHVLNKPPKLRDLRAALSRLSG